MNCVSGIQCVFSSVKVAASFGTMPSTRGLMSQPSVETMMSRVPSPSSFIVLPVLEG